MRVQIFRYLAVSVVLYGVVFSLAFFTPSFDFTPLDEPKKHFVSYVSLTAGLFLILTGLLLLLIIKRVKSHPFLLFPLRVVTAFLCLDGLISLFYFTFNPFAWILFVLSAALFGLSLWNTSP
ncbi:MAG: hypothetical protein LBP51_03685 [Deferribacteraceae bacterium]|jgi:hypothetical protein|nr:hypothetical protein [Deferribacteraceae bacterium]